MSLESILTLVAIVVGPLSAVLVTFWLQKFDQVKSRQIYIFRVLMANRRNHANHERISALNLIEVDFAKCKGVVLAHQKLITSYDSKLYRSADQSEVNQAVNESQYAYAELISEIAKTLGYKNIQQLDAIRGGYRPDALETYESQQVLMRNFVTQLAKGETALPVNVQGTFYNDTK